MIPKDAKLVFKGVLFDVYHWQQEMFDGTKKTYEKLKRRDSVTILPVTSDGKIILGREQQPGRKPFRSIAGGQVDDGETPEHAARRELLEETGYESGELVLWQVVHPYGEKVEWSVHGYIARGCKKVAEQQLDSGERISLELVTFDEFTQIAAFDPDFRVLELTLIVLRALQKPEEMQNLHTLLFSHMIK